MRRFVSIAAFVAVFALSGMTALANENNDGRIGRAPGETPSGVPCQGLYRAGELDQKAVAGSFNDSAVVLLDLGLDHVAPQRPDPSEGPFFVLAHKLREPNHIGGKDRAQTAAGGFTR